MTRKVGDIIDDIGLGCCQLRLSLIAGSVYTVGGGVLFLYATFASAIAVEFKLSSYERAMVGSVVYLGMLIGNWSCLAIDSMGIGRRRPPIMISLLGILMTAGLSANASSMWTIVVLWFLTGISYGIGVPVWNTLCSETTPTQWRLVVNGCSMTMFCVGSLNAACLVYAFMSDLERAHKHWRAILLWERIPNIVFLLLSFYPGYVESARVLAARGHLEEARQELEAMQQQNSAPDVSLVFDPDDDGQSDDAQGGMYGAFTSLSIAFGTGRWPTMCAVALTTFLLNFVTFGSMYTLPIVLSSVDLGMSAVLSIVVATLCEIGGYFLGFAMERIMGRRAMLLAYLSACALFTIVFILGVRILEADASSQHGILLVQTGINGARLFLSVGWTAAYVYVGEAFPTEARATASGICIGCGRLGSLSAPWVFEHLLLETETYLWYFVLTGTLCVINGVLVLLVLPETKGVALDEVTPLKRSPTSNKHA